MPSRRTWTPDERQLSADLDRQAARSQRYNDLCEPTEEDEPAFKAYWARVLERMTESRKIQEPKPCQPKSA